MAGKKVLDAVPGEPDSVSLAYEGRELVGLRPMVKKGQEQCKGRFQKQSDLGQNLSQKKKKKRIRYRVLSLRLGRMSFRLAGGH